MGSAPEGPSQWSIAISWLCSLKPHIYRLTSVGQGFRHALAGASTSWSLKRLHCCHGWSLTWKSHCREQTPQPGRQDLLPDWAVGPKQGLSSLPAVGLSLPSGCCPEAFSTRLVPLIFSALHKKSILFYGTSSQKRQSHCWAGRVTWIETKSPCPACTGGKQLFKGLHTRRQDHGGPLWSLSAMFLEQKSSIHVMALSTLLARDRQIVKEP